jgi:hypothetical protein
MYRMSLTLTCEEISETGQVTLGGWLTSVTAEDACDTDVVITHDYDNTTAGYLQWRWYDQGNVDGYGCLR